MRKPKEPDTPRLSPFERFTKAILDVPKNELDEKRAEDERRPKVKRNKPH